jgi:hypothetical protein
MRARRGISLIEGIIGLGLALLLGFMVFKVIFPSFRIVQEGQIKSEIQQQGQLGMQQLVADLQNSVPTGISLGIPVASEPMVVGVHPLVENLNTGAVEFRPELILWWHDTANFRLRRKVFKNPDPSGVTLSFQPFEAMQTPRGNLDLIIASTNNSEKNFALSVRSFNVQKEGTTGGEVYACRIFLEKDIPGKERKASAQIFRKVMLRNHL